MVETPSVCLLVCNHRDDLLVVLFGFFDRSGPILVLFVGFFFYWVSNGAVLLSCFNIRRRLTASMAMETHRKKSSDSFTGFDLFFLVLFLDVAFPIGVVF